MPELYRTENGFEWSWGAVLVKYLRGHLLLFRIHPHKPGKPNLLMLWFSKSRGKGIVSYKIKISSWRASLSFEWYTGG